MSSNTDIGNITAKQILNCWDGVKIKSVGLSFNSKTSLLNTHNNNSISYLAILHKNKKLKSTN